MRNLHYLFVIASLLLSAPLGAQKLSLDDFKKKNREQFNSYKDSLRASYNAFREKINREQAQFLSSPWTRVEFEDPTPMPPTPRPVVKDDDNITVIDRKILRIDTVYVPLPKPLPRPKPIISIDDDLTPKPKTYLQFEFFGTSGKVRDNGLSALTFGDGQSLGDLWMAFYNIGADETVADMLEIRDRYKLCDWAFRGAAEQMSRAMFRDDRLATLFNGYIMANSGYKVRFLSDRDGNLYLGYKTDMYLYNLASVSCYDGLYYVADSKFRDKKMDIVMCDFSIPGEQALSMRINNVQHFDLKPSAERVVGIKYHEAQGDTVRARVNENLVTFYDTYPKVWYHDRSAWQVVAEFPVDRNLTDTLYPQLRKLIAGKNQQDAVNILMGVCQSFPYGYDNQIWGYDYPLSVEQTWFHPYSDCEDHAIHLTRLVRDLLGLKTALIYLPNHLVAGIVFTDSNPDGCKLQYGGKEYLICDPTYFGEPIGKTFVATDTDQTALYLIE